MLYNELFWAGLDRQEFLQVKDPIDNSNRRAVFIWSICIGIFWCLSLVLSFFLPAYEQCRLVYVGALICSVFTWFGSAFLTDRYPWLLYPVMFLLAFSILMAGIEIAICQPDVRTATMIAVVVMMPSCFIVPTIYSILLLSATIIIYCIFGKGAIEPPIFSWGLTNLLIFSLAGIVTT